MLNVICLNYGDYVGRGVQYVNTLYREVVRNSTLPMRFIVFVDFDSYIADEGKYAKGVEVRALPDDKGVRGWNWKLYFFKRGLFAPGERVVFIDLDTIITGNIDELLAYDGEFAILRDFMQPGVYGPGVMAWQADALPMIWDDFVAEGKPRDLDLGDLTWINHIFNRDGYRPDLLQDIVKGVYSYKVDCKAGLPADARIVCFHGLPRPHQVYDDFIVKHWWGDHGTGNS